MRTTIATATRAGSRTSAVIAACLLAANGATEVGAIPPGVATPTKPLPPIVAAPQDSIAVHTAAELAARLNSTYRGRIVIPADANWRMEDPCGTRDEFGRCVVTPLMRLPVRSGVEIVGERGALGRRPTLAATYQGEDYSLFVTQGNDIRISGVHLLGPSRRTTKKQSPVTAILAIQDPLGSTGRRVTIADNELDGWPGAAISVCGNYAQLDPGACDMGARGPREHSGPLTTRADAGSMRIERNYIHHNARDGLGYGVVTGGNSYTTIEGNVFDFNRHDIASDGRAFNGYVARFNYALQGGFTYGSSGYWGHHFDVHGSGTEEGRKNGHYDGGMAGEFYEIAFNTFRGAQRYGVPVIAARTRAAFELRGRPTMGASFVGNVAVHDGGAVRLKGGSDRRLFPATPSKFNLTVAGNRLDTDYSTEIAGGDFDGDGRTDVFVANGTAWFLSRGGSEPWEYLRPSNKRVRDLAFADIDNDRRTDVLYRDGAGNLGYVAGGAAADLTPLTTLPVPIGALRSGDFDGDGRTDLFHASSGQWMVWHGSTRAWTPAQSSSKPMSELLFGDFDDVKGTDVAAVTSGVWAISSGATGSWTRINGRLVDSFARAVAADFDGNGRTDIAFPSGGTWRFSADGRGPLRTLRSGGTRILHPLFGRFDGSTKTVAIGFPLRAAVPPIGERLVMWRGLGSPAATITRSLQNMR